jgi:D-lactate dehydrogenase
VKVAIFSAKKYDREFLNAANDSRHELRFFEPHLNEETVGLAAGFGAVCVFVNGRNATRSDARLTNAASQSLLRSSPYAVAEHTIALMLALNRKVHRAYNRVREGNFALDGLVGFDMHGKTVGLIGTGQIGSVAAQILTGFGCPILAFDPVPNAVCRSIGVRYVELNELLAQSDIVSLHCPLTPENKYIINEAAIAGMKNSVTLINTSRGALLDTVGIIEGLKSGKIAYLGLDVYEEEEEIFFEDRSGLILSDDVFARLLTFPNVIITGHQAFFTREALLKIAATTIDNITKFENNQPLEKLAR